ncbi:MAG: thioredoxin domain-containing protein [Candidatus Anammoxibacter sp.]
MKKRTGKLFSIFVLGIAGAAMCLVAPQNLFSSANTEKRESKPIKHDEKSHYNRLKNEKSPYLLQHAENPVDWFAWGEEAFEKARKENKPIFLSIGYSTCHWCHVMAHESFEDPEVARLLNETFICIKVDREERPDIDNIYMSVCQMMTGSGGWPLTIFMTPEKKPFFAGTYFPKEGRFQRPGLLELIPKIKKMWEEGRDEIEKTADKITERLKINTRNISGKELGVKTLSIAYHQLAQRFDASHGGFGRSPKFPSPQNLLFLLRHWKRTGDSNALKMVEETLSAMRKGGIYDHIGFGFHRYSTDREWLVPHFEKMLYDQAMLALAYTETFQATGKDEYKEIAKEIFTYVLRDMTSDNGGFYSAEDADSEGEEGKFYVWGKDEISQILKGKDLDVIIKVFNVKKTGNFREGKSILGFGKNILHLDESFVEIAAELKIPEKELRNIVEKSRRKLFDVRSKRIYPHKDDKILTDWNGLMIAALAKGARVFNDKEYEKAAVNSADFILKSMRRSDGRLLHRYRDSDAAILANIDDYVFLIWGLIELYETTFKVDYLQKAVDLNNELIKHFWDKKGGFYFTADDAEELLFRQKEIYDGAIPSGNSVALLNLLRLGRITANSSLEEKAMDIITAFSNSVAQSPSFYAQLMVGLDFGVGPSYEVVIVGNSQADDSRDMLKAIRKQFIPNKVVLFMPTEQKSPDIVKISAFTKDLISIDNKATAYVCLNYACKSPTTDVNTMLEFLNVKNRQK